MRGENESYVQRDGLAVVHRGEKIVAAPGSESVLVEAGRDVHYHFPVHVVAVGDVGEAVRAEIEARIWHRLHSALA